MLGVIPEGIYLYFRTRFPTLLIVVYGVVYCHCKQEEWFRKYMNVVSLYGWDVLVISGIHVFLSCYQNPLYLHGLDYKNMFLWKILGHFFMYKWQHMLCLKTLMDLQLELKMTKLFESRWGSWHLFFSLLVLFLCSRAYKKVECKLALAPYL